MKRLDLVQLTIIIVGLLSAFFCLRLLPQLMIYFFSWFTDGLRGGFFMQSLIGNIILLTVYLLFSMFSIRNSKQLADWISNKADLQADINLSLNKTELLFAFFVGMGLYGLVQELPSLLADGYNYITESNSFQTGLDYRQPGKQQFIIECIQVILFSILLFNASVFAGFFASKINNTEPVDEINSNTE